MPTDLLARLEAWKKNYGCADPAGLRRLLGEVAGAWPTEAASLIRLHECLLFFRAYPPDAAVLRLAGRLLSCLAAQVAAVRDPVPFEEPDVSGIAGTSFSAVFSYEVARRLSIRHPRRIDIDWENYDTPDKLGPVLRRILPLVAEDWPVEAHVPFRAWIDAARGRGRTALAWLLESIAALPLDERGRADLYESLDLLLVWRIGDSAESRTRMRRAQRHPFYHREPLLRRSDISLARELAAPPLPITRLGRSESRRALDRILDTSAVRYRELYGFTHPDEAHVWSADAGRGVEIVFFGVPPAWRLPLRAYHCGMFFKNGVPAGYVEVLSLFERADVGFNLYYTFREGESAWIYARLLRLFRQTLGVTCFSVDPYQIGHENDEALDSGAFWFYRKLGFRPLDPDAARLVEREEKRMRATPGYRSSRRTLEQISRSYLLYESDDAGRGDWDRFRVRQLAIGWDRARWNESDRKALDAVQKAKYAPDEARYLRLMRQYPRLRAAMIRMGGQHS